MKNEKLLETANSLLYKAQELAQNIIEKGDDPRFEKYGYALEMINHMLADLELTIWSEFYKKG